MAQIPEQEFEQFLRRLASLRPELCDAFRRISETLPALREGDKISHRQKKASLRSLISNVILKSAAQEAVEIKIAHNGSLRYKCEEYRRIGRVLDVNHQLVINWINSYHAALPYRISLTGCAALESLSPFTHQRRRAMTYPGLDVRR